MNEEPSRWKVEQLIAHSQELRALVQKEVRRGQAIVDKIRQGEDKRGKKK